MQYKTDNLLPYTSLVDLLVKQPLETRYGWQIRDARANDIQHQVAWIKFRTNNSRLLCLSQEIDQTDDGRFLLLLLLDWPAYKSAPAFGCLPGL